jgi:hypothetical protein
LSGQLEVLSQSGKAANVCFGSKADTTLMSAMGGKRTQRFLRCVMANHLWILLASLVAGCGTLDSRRPASELSYGCNELVVIGRIVTLGGTTIPDTDASLPNWRSEWQLSIEIKRVIRGAERRAIVPATGVSHAQIRNDRDFLVVLHPFEGGAYSLETAALWDIGPRPRLIEPCS